MSPPNIGLDKGTCRPGEVNTVRQDRVAMVTSPVMGIDCGLSPVLSVRTSVCGASTGGGCRRTEDESKITADLSEWNRIAGAYG